MQGLFYNTLTKKEMVGFFFPSVHSDLDTELETGSLL